MKVVWIKQVKPKAWRRVAGISIADKRDAVENNQFRSISLLNVEKKFSLVLWQGH